MKDSKKLTIPGGKPVPRPARRVTPDGRTEKRIRNIQDPEGRAVPVFVLVDLKRGERLRVTTIVTTTVEVVTETKRDKKPRTIASVRPGNPERRTFGPRTKKK